MRRKPGGLYLSRREGEEAVSPWHIQKSAAWHPKKMPVGKRDHGWFGFHTCEESCPQGPQA